MPFTVTYHPGLPNIGRILRDVHPVIQSSDRCKEAIAGVPMIAFRGPKCLADYLVHARVKGGQRDGGERGTHKCGSTRREVCDYLDERSCFKVTPNLRGCLPEKNSYARCFLGNHHNLYIDKKLN